MVADVQLIGAANRFPWPSKKRR